MPLECEMARMQINKFRMETSGCEQPSCIRRQAGICGSKDKSTLKNTLAFAIQVRTHFIFMGLRKMLRICLNIVQ